MEKYFLAISTKIPKRGNELEGEEVYRINEVTRADGSISSLVVVQSVRMLYSDIYETKTNKGTYIVKIINVPERVRFCHLYSVPVEGKPLQCRVLKFNTKYEMTQTSLTGKIEIVKVEKMGFFCKIESRKNIFYGLMPPKKESNP